MAKRKRVQPIQPPPELEERVKEVWANNEVVQNYNRQVEENEESVRSFHDEIAKAKRDYEKACDDAAKDLREKNRRLAEMKKEGKRLRALRNTAKNKLYRKEEREYLKRIRAGIGIKQTWADPMVKRSIQQGDLIKSKKGADISDL